jgi:biotin operon repressor
MLEALAKEGYLIVENPALAKDVDEKLKREKRESDYRGVRGFDKKYYLISKSGLAELEKKFDKALAKEKQLKAVADELGVKEGLAKAAIEVLREEGKIIEKRRGTYCLA